MTDRRTTEVLGSLPRTRPHRRSEKRAARAPDGAAAAPAPPPVDAGQARSAAAKPARTAAAKPARTTAAKPARTTAAKPARTTAAKPARTAAAKPARTAAAKPARPAPARPPSPAPPLARRAVLGTAVQVAAELTEIGLTAGARALRRAASRLPRP